MMALGYSCAYSEALATKVMEAGAVPALQAILKAPVQDHILSTAVWALGMLGSHSARHAKAVAGGCCL